MHATVGAVVDRVEYAYPKLWAEILFAARAAKQKELGYHQSQESQRHGNVDHVPPIKQRGALFQRARHEHKEK